MCDIHIELRTGRAEVESPRGDWTEHGKPSWFWLKFWSRTCCHMLIQARLVVDFQLVVQLAYRRYI